jgi:hypothetical protein
MYSVPLGQCRMLHYKEVGTDESILVNEFRNQDHRYYQNSLLPDAIPMLLEQHLGV